MMPMVRWKRVGGSVLAGLLVWGSVSVTADTSLIGAVKSLDRPAVRALLQKRADVNAAEADGTTALYWAAERDDLEMVDLLIAAKADPNAKTRYGFSPLAMAAINGNAKIVERLLEGGRRRQWRHSRRRDRPHDGRSYGNRRRRERAPRAWRASRRCRTAIVDRPR